MKKNTLNKLLVVPFAVLTLTGCDDVEIPEVTDGKDTVLSSLKGTPDQNDAKNVLFATLGKLDGYKSYKKVSSNLTTAKKGFIDYSQQTNATMIRNDDEYYTDSSSHSSFVDMRHVALYKGGKVAYFNKDGKIKNSNYEDYFKAYGVTPNKLLTGQILNQDTILLAKLDKAEDNKYTYTYVLDKTKANDLLAHQTYMFGSLNGLPTFTDHTTFTLTISGDYTPISYTYTSSYTINVSVLGDMDCKETCTATFGDFNKTIEVPQSAELNAAINETPTIIVPTEAEDYGDLTVLVSALLNSDINNGVALSGTFQVGKYQLPIKLKTKVDVNGLVNGGDASDLVDAQVSIPLPTGDASVIYHEGKVYVDILGKKVVFATEAKAQSNTDFDNVVADINSLIEVKKSETSVNTYTITLKDEAMSILKFVLEAGGLISHDDEVDFSLDLYVTSDRIAGVYADLEINGSKAIGTNFLYQDEYFKLPDISEYASELSLSGSSKFSVGADSIDRTTGENKNDNSLNLNITYNTLEANPLKALDLEAEFVLGANFKNLLTLASAWDTGMEIPGIISSLSKAKYLDITFKDGVLDLYSFAEFSKKDEEGESIAYDDLIYHERYDFTNLGGVSYLPEYLNDDENVEIEENGFSFLSLADYLDIDINDSSIDLSLDEDFILDVVDTLQVEGQLMTTAIEKLGEYGSTLLTSLGLYKPISDISLSIPLSDEKDASLKIMAYNTNIYTGTWNPETIKNVSEVNFFSFSVSADYDSDHTYGLDADKLATYTKAVNEIIDEYDALLAGYELAEEYLAKLTALEAKYKALADNLKYWINAHYNSSTSPIAKTIATYTSDLANAKLFITYVNDGKDSLADTCYKKFNQAEINYINKQDSALIANYLNNRQAREAEEAKAYMASIVAFEWKETSKMTTAELLAYYGEAIKLFKKKDQFVTTNLTIDSFINKVMHGLTPIYVKKMNDYAEELANEFYGFTVIDTLDYETIENYAAAMKGFANNYYNDFNKVINFASCVGEELANEFNVNVQKAVSYYNSGLGGYQKSIARSMDKKMADILANEDQTAAEAAVKEMFNWFSDNTDYRKLCPNYDALYAKYKDIIDEIDNDGWDL